MERSPSFDHDEATMPSQRLNLIAIEQALRSLQEQFPRINKLLKQQRDSMDDSVVANMMAGYAFVDTALADDLDLFAFGNLKFLLELNARVLCGTAAEERLLVARHLEATREHFYDDTRGGIRDIVEWRETHRDESVWKRAAGVYVRVLSEPQLFIEGNHRTGALIMSYILAREKEPPFVLTLENARAYFDPSSVITKMKKKSVSMLFRMPNIKKSFAEFLKQQADRRFLAKVAKGQRAAASGRS